MSGRFVRASKYRHVYGRPSKKEQCYDNLRISRNAWDSNLIKANPKYLSVNWEASGGGAFAVIPLAEKGRLPESIPLFRGHTAPVLDTDWSPFDDSLIASGSDDGKVFLWRVPPHFTVHTPENVDPTDIAPTGKLIGHSRKVGHVLFSPSANHVLATSAGDYTVKLWDISKGESKAKLTLNHGDIVQSMSFAPDSGLLVTTSRDKKLRIWDPRQQKPAQEVPGHAGAKNSRAVWMGEQGRIATTGFSKMSDRQLGLWDVREPGQGPIGGFENLDSMSGVCMPFWDEGTRCLYLAGKGDGNIRYFEYENDKFEFLSEYKSADPQRGIAFMPKRGINTHDNEVLLAFKTVADSYIEPISFIVPRRAEVFQSDIYPPCVGSTPGLSADEWFGGKNKSAPKISLESIYDGNGEGDTVADEARAAPPPSSSSATATSSAPAPAPGPVPSAEKPSPSSSSPTKPIQTPAPAAAAAAAQEEKTARGAPPSMKDQKSSISDLASKFQDKDAASSEEDDEETPPGAVSAVSAAGAAGAVVGGARKEREREKDGFDEPPRTLGVTAYNEPKATPVRKAGGEHVLPPNLSSSKAKDGPGAARAVPVAAAAAAVVPAAGKTASGVTSPTKGAAGTGGAGGAGGGVESSLSAIHQLLETQNRVLAAQSEKIGLLTSEVDGLKKSVRGGDETSGAAGTGAGSGTEELSARIRELEGQLERERLRGGGGGDD